MAHKIAVSKGHRISRTDEFLVSTAVDIVVNRMSIETPAQGTTP